MNNDFFEYLLTFLCNIEHEESTQTEIRNSKTENYIF